MAAPAAVGPAGGLLARAGFILVVHEDMASTLSFPCACYVAPAQRQADLGLVLPQGQLLQLLQEALTAAQAPPPVPPAEQQQYRQQQQQAQPSSSAPAPVTTAAKAAVELHVPHGNGKGLQGLLPVCTRRPRNRMMMCHQHPARTESLTWPSALHAHIVGSLEAAGGVVGCPPPASMTVMLPPCRFGGREVTVRCGGAAAGCLVHARRGTRKACGQQVAIEARISSLPQAMRSRCHFPKLDLLPVARYRPAFQLPFLVAPCTPAGCRCMATCGGLRGRKRSGNACVSHPPSGPWPNCVAVSCCIGYTVGHVYPATPPFSRPKCQNLHTHAHTYTHVQRWCRACTASWRTCAESCGAPGPSSGSCGTSECCYSRR